MAKDGKKLTNKVLYSKKPLTNTFPQNKPSLISRTLNELPFITFSFKYYSQQEYFGIGEQQASWFESLFERIKDLSNKTSKILEDRLEKQNYRLHHIDWNAKNCPITIDELKGLPNDLKKYAKENKEFVFWQFQLSKSNGRVIGFFDENHEIFYIVLLDPKHNLQPSKDYGYSVDDTEIAFTEFEKINMRIANATNQSNNCKSENLHCKLYNAVHNEYINSDVFYAYIDPCLKDTYKSLVESGEFQNKLNDFLFENI